VVAREIDLDLKKAALIAEISGAAAVVVSLIFVGYQLKQSNEQAALNTEALRLTAYQQLIDGISDFNTLTIENSEIRSIRTRLRNGESLDDLNPDEWEVMNAFLYLQYRNADLAYLQYQAQIMNEERLRSGLGLLLPMLYLPTIQDHWNRSKGGFVPEFRSYIDDLVEEINSKETGR
jgi:hypothetical protein